MNRIQLNRTVNAPAAVVWATLTDMDAWTTILSGITAVERLDDSVAFEVGTTWRETRTMFGKEATETMQVVELRDGASYVTTYDSNGAHYRTEIGVEADGNDVSTIRMSFEATPTNPVATIAAATIGRLFQGLTRTALQTDLDDLAVAAEARAR